MRVMLRVRAALHIRKVLLILALKRSFESLRSASDFFQYFNPSNTCLQVLDLIEFFLLKLPPILKKVTL